MKSKYIKQNVVVVPNSVNILITLMNLSPGVKHQSLSKSYSKYYKKRIHNFAAVENSFFITVEHGILQPTLD